MTAKTPFDLSAPCLFVGNDLIRSTGPGQGVVNPSTLTEVGCRAEASEADSGKALAAAEAARSGWAGLDAKSRAKALHAMATAIETADPEPVARLSRHGLDAFRRAKMGIIDGRATLQDWWYPYKDGVFYHRA